MATSAELATQLESQKADYLKKLENGGQLPTVVNNAWNAADAGGTAKLRTEEAAKLTDYVSAGANARDKYKDVWDPFTRDKLAANQVAMDYAPIADIRNELAMRAQALGVATQAATSMYNADTEKSKTALGFTQDAYDRAYQREQDAIKRSDSKATAAKSLTSPGNLNDVNKIIEDVPSDNPNNPKDKYISKNEAAQAFQRIKATYQVDDATALDMLNKGLQAGGWIQWESLSPAQQKAILQQQASA